MHNVEHGRHEFNQEMPNFNYCMPRLLKLMPERDSFARRKSICSFCRLILQEITHVLIDVFGPFLWYKMSCILKYN